MSQGGTFGFSRFLGGCDFEGGTLGFQALREAVTFDGGTLGFPRGLVIRSVLLFKYISYHEGFYLA